MNLPPPADIRSELGRLGSGLILTYAAVYGSACLYVARCAKYVPKFGGLSP